MSKGSYSPHQSSIANMDANIMAILTYALPVIAAYLPIVWSIAWLIPILIFFMEKKSNLVKFHAMQSVVLYVVRVIVISILHVIPLLGGLASFIVGIIFTLIAIVAVIGAFNYEEFRIPFIGDFVARLIK